MKKTISLFLALICVLTFSMTGSALGAEQPLAEESTAIQERSSSAYIDVQEGAWYEEAVGYCLNNGILSGTSNNTFAPSDSMTRAMLATVLYRIEKPSATQRSASFSDVASSAWYGDAVGWAAEQGIVTGYGNGIFGANDAVTREQMAAILWRYAGSSAGSVASNFADASRISSWAVSAVNWTKAEGIISGTSGNRFAPMDPVTRAEAAAMLYRWLEKPGSADKTVKGKVLVAYFSATGTTRTLAEYAASVLHADLYEIEPAQAYTAADLAYNTNGRADREQNDATARPAISGSVKNMQDYDVVLLGYPIWHGQAPQIISAFLESYDFSGKTIVPFCTSSSSGIGASDTNLHSLAAGAHWLKGQRFAGGASQNTIEEWINGLDLPTVETEETRKPVFNFDTRTVTLNSGYKMPIHGLGTYSLHGDTCINAVKSALSSGVRLIDTASAYGNEEEIGQAIRAAIDQGVIKREDIFVTTKIYPGTEMANPEQAIQDCLDRLNIGYVDMMLLHHPDTNDVKAYKAMEQFVASGKIRSIGLSNWYVEELTGFLPQVNITPALVQNEIHPYYQENDIIPFIQDLGIVVQGWYPLGGRGHTAELLGDEVITEIAKAHGVSAAQVILRWNLQKGVVVIPGSSNPAHIQENTELYGFQLTADEMARINGLDRGEKHDWY